MRACTSNGAVKSSYKITINLDTVYVVDCKWQDFFFVFAISLADYL